MERRKRPRRRIAVISPVVATDAIDVEATLEPFCSSSFDVENFFIDEGPASIENETDVAACLPGLLATSARLELKGWHALIINCMCDPGLGELRTALRIPVFGPAETSMRAIACYGGRFSVLDVVAEGRALVEEQAGRYGVRANYVSHRAIDVPVLELFRDPVHTVTALEGAALKCVRDGADTLLLGCTGLAELAQHLRSNLEAKGLWPSVLEPLRTTLAIAQALLSVEAAPADRS